MKTASQIIEALGGSAAISRETSFPLTTIESWKAPNFIPGWRRDRLLTMADKLKVPVFPADFPEKASAPTTQQEAA